MAIDNKTDLIKEIEVFSKALCDCRGIIGADYSDVGNVIIPISKFAPYYSEQGILKRNDYSEEILDEEAFLVFYGLFFDMIELNPNAEKVSDSQYFNTLYQSYKDKQKRKIADLDLFMQLVETKKEKEAISRNNNKFDMIEVFLHHVLIDKTRGEIKSKISPNKSLFDLINKVKTNRKNNISSAILSLAMFLIGGLMISFYKPNLIIVSLIISFATAVALFCLFYCLSNRVTKQEKEEVKQLPKSFKDYLLGEYRDFNKEFFNDKTTSYLDPLFKDSEIYKYVKGKYTKLESENSITNE